MLTLWCPWNNASGGNHVSSRHAARAAVLLLATAPDAFAHGYRAGALGIEHPVISEPYHGAHSTCARLTIVNYGRSTEYLDGISTKAAARTLVLATTGDRGGADRPLGIAIEPGARLELRRPAWCILLSGINTALAADVDEVAGTLMFRSQGAVDITFMIAPAGP